MSSGFWVVLTLRFTVASIKPQVSIAPECASACKTAQKIQLGIWESRDGFRLNACIIAQKILLAVQHRRIVFIGESFSLGAG